MIGIDTNVLLRALLDDEPRQSRQAAAILQSLSRESPGFVASVVLAEIVWTLTSAYRLDREAVAGMVITLLGREDLVLEHADAVAEAADLYLRSKADFSDILIALVAQRAGATTTYAFDKAAAGLDQMTSAWRFAP